MRTFFNLVVLLLIISWAAGFFVFQLGYTVHVLLIAALVMALVRSLHWRGLE